MAGELFAELIARRGNAMAVLKVGDKVRVQLSNGYRSTGVVVRVFKNGRYGIRETTALIIAPPVATMIDTTCALGRMRKTP
jgi:hypothetical protein